MNQHHTIIEQYRGYNIIHNLCGHARTDFYKIQGSDIVLASVKAARNVIDTWLRNVSENDIPDTCGGGYGKQAI